MFWVNKRFCILYFDKLTRPVVQERVRGNGLQTEDNVDPAFLSIDSDLNSDICLNKQFAELFRLLSIVASLNSVKGTVVVIIELQKVV